MIYYNTVYDREVAGFSMHIDDTTYEDDMKQLDGLVKMHNIPFEKYLEVRTAYINLRNMKSTNITKYVKL